MMQAWLAVSGPLQTGQRLNSASSPRTVTHRAGDAATTHARASRHLAMPPCQQITPTLIPASKRAQLDQPRSLSLSSNMPPPGSTRIFTHAGGEPYLGGAGLLFAALNWLSRACKAACWAVCAAALEAAPDVGTEVPPAAAPEHRSHTHCQVSMMRGLMLQVSRDRQPQHCVGRS